jgi:TolB protein
MQFKFSPFKFLLLTVSIISGINSFSQKPGVFEGQNDVGKILHPGSGTYNASKGDYVLSGSGTNIWFTHDDFHYVWKKIKGNFILQARGHLIGKGVVQHRKFGWMVRANIDSTSAMVSATIHGDGLTSLQYRKLPKTNVEETKICHQCSRCNSVREKRKSIHHVCSSFWGAIRYTGNY